MASLRKRKFGKKARHVSFDSRPEPAMLSTRGIIEVADLKYETDYTVPQEAVPFAYFVETSKFQVPIAMLVFLITFLVYLFTAYPTVSGGDSGELIMTACNLSMAHPPGYPLFTMLSRLFIILIPFGHLAWRVGVMSCTCGAGAAAFIYATVYQCTGSRAAGAFAAFGFAFSNTVWLYSIQGEVFALNNLLISLISYITVRYYHSVALLGTSASDWKRDSRAASTGHLPAKPYVPRKPMHYVLLGSFVGGLCLTNQHTSVFPVAACVICIFASVVRNGLLTKGRFCAMTGCFLIGISPYIYLPLSASLKPLDGWGDQRTWGGFIHHFLRREYGTFQLAADGTSEDPGMGSRLLTYWIVLLDESLVVTPFVALCGSIWMMMSNLAVSKSSKVIFLGWFIYLIVFHKLANLSLEPLYLGVQARFWMQCNLPIYLFSGVGVQILSKITARFVLWFYRSCLCFGPKNGREPNSIAARYRMTRIILNLFVVTYSFAQCYRNYARHDHSNNWSNWVQGEKILNAFPENAVVLLNGDINNNLVKYPQMCEGQRKDLNLIGLQQMTWPWFVPMNDHHYPKVVFPGTRFHPHIEGAFSMKEFLDANYKRTKSLKKIFLCGPFKEGDDSHKKHYVKAPFGMCAKLLKKKHSNPSNWTKILKPGFAGVPLQKELGEWKPWQYTAETWEKIVYQDAWNRLVYLASYTAFQSNQVKPQDPQLLELAKQIMDEIFDPVNKLEGLLRQKGALSADIYRAAGIIYGQWAAEIASKQTGEDVKMQARTAELEMLRLWKQYSYDKPSDKEMDTFVENRINPYNHATVAELGEDPLDDMLQELKKQQKRKR